MIQVYVVRRNLQKVKYQRPYVFFQNMILFYGKVRNKSASEPVLRFFWWMKKSAKKNVKNIIHHYGSSTMTHFGSCTPDPSSLLSNVFFPHSEFSSNIPPVAWIGRGFAAPGVRHIPSTTPAMPSTSPALPLVFINGSGMGSCAKATLGVD